jgi:hypothetical protein
MLPRTALALAVVTLLALAPAAAPAQPPGVSAPGAEREQAYVDALRREDPQAAERYVALRDAQNLAIAELDRAQRRYNAGGPALRPVALPQVRQARRKYAETTLALLDFLDARDRDSIAALHERIEQLNRVRQERSQSRAEMEQLLRE